MASAQLNSKVTIYKKSPSGSKERIFTGSVSQLAPAGGAPDGAFASVATPEKLLSVNSGVILNNDDILEVSVTSAIADGYDVTDTIWSIPLATSSGSTVLQVADFANPALADTTFVANVETVVGGYKIVEGPCRVAGKIFVDIQNDTA